MFFCILMFLNVTLRLHPVNSTTVTFSREGIALEESDTPVVAADYRYLSRGTAMGVPCCWRCSPVRPNQLTIISRTLQKGEDLIIGRHLREIPRDAKWKL